MLSTQQILHPFAIIGAGNVIDLDSPPPPLRSSWTEGVNPILRDIDQPAVKKTPKSTHRCFSNTPVIRVVGIKHQVRDRVIKESGRLDVMDNGSIRQQHHHNSPRRPG
ncbi:hypothetical protein PM082_005094 [Marasmius tenuissimus]|nr:hypothetical protein PM082_005094 [Marasmius tenuissimus]